MQFNEISASGDFTTDQHLVSADSIAVLGELILQRNALQLFFRQREVGLAFDSQFKIFFSL